MWKKQLILGAALVLAGAGVAQADEAASAYQSTYLRSGPSTHYKIIEHVPKDAEVSVGHCANRWCAVTVGNNSGYIAESMLAFDENTDPNADNAPPAVVQTYVEPDDGYYDYYDGYDAPFIFGGGFYPGGGYYHHWHGDHGQWHGGNFHGGMHGGFHGGSHGGPILRH